MYAKLNIYRVFQNLKKNELLDRCKWVEITINVNFQKNYLQPLTPTQEVNSHPDWPRDFLAPNYEKKSMDSDNKEFHDFLI